MTLLMTGQVIAADPWPRLYAVTGVAADDVLNIRSDPRAGADKIGALAPDAREVEIVRRDSSGSWGRVNVMEHGGWVSMRYLAPQGPGFDADYPGPLHCYGTEPFWSLSADPGSTAEFRFFDAEPAALSAGARQPAMGYSDRLRFALGDSGQAIIRRAECSDGMSDNAFALEIDLILDDDRFLTGCCSIAPR
ncbi:SH3 domain-containing protein [Ruegeria sp. 2012CJ41-6]|uniref:SH3 domain-containing protein n=1 Tax=Ruegeria spongiae TaxID=2942209 RepID=A0ABT0Q5M3_9RHOB|nr:SH3 domain-containing protein [Ruegeria spongiae]MCL6285171.1 SH3 domain-containing protein [Ruegeria spongiae]